MLVIACSWSVNEELQPGYLVEADVFSVSLEGEPRATAEIDEIAWVDPARPGDIELAPLTRETVLRLLQS
jgi:8-oxo-dGTP diphosphatase